MPVTATITKEQRDGLYELVRHHLYSIDDLWIAFGRNRDYGTAERSAWSSANTSGSWRTSAGPQTTIARASS